MILPLCQTGMCSLAFVAPKGLLEARIMLSFYLQRLLHFTL